MLEQEFFKAFGIEKRCIEKSPTYCADYDGICEYCRGLGYPEITAEILLKLICVYINNNSYFDLFVRDVQDLKQEILKWAISFVPNPNDEVKREDFIKYVQALFEEE